MKKPTQTFPYRYTGPETNLGRHDLVKSGDIVQLNADEIVSLQGDARFSLVTAEDAAKAETLPGTITGSNAEQAAEMPLEGSAPLPKKTKKG